MARLAHIWLWLLLVLALCTACFEQSPDPTNGDIDRAVLKGSTEGGNAIPIRFIAPDLKTSGLDRLTLRFGGAVTPDSPVFSDDTKEHYSPPMATLVVPVLPRAKQEILLPLPAERFYALDFEWPLAESALSADGHSATGQAIHLDLNLRGVLRFRFLLEGLYISSSALAPLWLIVMDPGPAFAPEFLARIKAGDDGSLRIDAAHNPELQEEAARLLLSRFLLFNDPNRDGFISLEERTAENRLGQGAQVDVLSAGTPCDEAAPITGSCTRLISGSTESGSGGFQYCGLSCDPDSHTLKEICDKSIPEVGYCHPYLCQDGWLTQLIESDDEPCGPDGGPIQEGYGCKAGGVCEWFGKAPVLVIDPASSADAPIDFGEVQVGQHASRTILLSNDGTANLTILSLDLAPESNPDFIIGTDDTIPTPGNQTITIKPGEAFPLNISVYVTSSGIRKATLQITSNSYANPIQYVYLATSEIGTTTINVTPDLINFSAVEVGKKEIRSFYIKNVVSSSCDPTLTPPPEHPCNKAVGITNFKIDGEGFGQFSIESVVPVLDSDPPHYITPGQAFEVKVAFHPNRANDETNPVYDAYVRFYHDADINPYGGKYEQIKVNLSGTGVVPKLCATPDNVIFNQIPIGADSAKAVKLANCGGAPLIIDSIVWDPNYTQPAGCEIQSQGSVGAMLDASQFTFFNVVCTPPTLNPQSGFIIVTWNGDQSVSIPVSYTVVADQVFIEPAGSLDFGPVKIGNTQNGFVRITNQGGSPITVLSSTDVTNNNYEFSLTAQSKANLPKVLSTNQSMMLELIYSPRVQQTVQTTGTFTIMTSSLSMPKKDLPLLGTPLWPVCDFRLVEDDVLLSPGGTIDFGQVVTGSSATRTLRIDNTSGTYDCEVPVFRKGLNSADQYSFNPPIIPAVPGGTYYDVQITCAPTTESILQGTLVIVTNDLRPEIASFSLSLDCTGVRPALQVEPSSSPIELGSVGLNECGSPVTVTLRNIGRGSLKLCRPTATNDGWGQPASSSCTTPMGEWNSWTYINGSGTRVEGDYTCWYLRPSASTTDAVSFSTKLCGCNESFPEGSTTPKSLGSTYNIQTNDPALFLGIKTLSFHGEIHP